MNPERSKFCEAWAMRTSWASDGRTVKPSSPRAQSSGPSVRRPAVVTMATRASARGGGAVKATSGNS